MGEYDQVMDKMESWAKSDAKDIVCEEAVSIMEGREL